MKLKRGIIIGVIIGMLFSYGIVNASSFTKNLLVYYGIANKIVINGLDKTPTDTMPFVYEGTTYVPLRYISEALGSSVGWEGSTGTIFIGEQPNKNITYLSDLPLYSYDNVTLLRTNNSTDEDKNITSYSYYFPSGYVMKAAGTEYAKGISLIPNNKAYPSTDLIFNLNGQYSTLSGVVNYADQWMERAGKDIIKFYVDDILKGQYTIEKGKLPQNFEISVKNGLQLRIEIIRPSDSTGHNPVVNLLDLKLKK